jgi:hypothetical protein
MATYYPSTSWPAQFANPDTGELLSGGVLRAFVAGSSTPATMYRDGIGTSAGAAITLNAGGYPTVSSNIIVVWLDAAVQYKFTLEDSLGGSKWSVDNIASIVAGGDSPNLCKTVADLTDTIGPLLANGRRITAAQVDALANTGAAIETTWNNTASKTGGAKYQIKTRAQHRIDIANPTWTPDGYFDHYLLGGTTYVAVFTQSGPLMAEQGGFSTSASGTVNRQVLEAAFARGIYVEVMVAGEGTYDIGSTSMTDSDSAYLAPVDTEYGILLAGGKMLRGSNATLNYTGTGNAVYMRNSANHMTGFTILTPDGAESALKIQGSLNQYRDIVITTAAGGTTGAEKGVWLYSDRTTLQTDWNYGANVTVNPAILPVCYESKRSQPAPGGSIGAVNSNKFDGTTNWRTSAAAGGVVLYINGGTADSADMAANSFHDVDVSNYGGAGSKSIVIDGPNTRLTSFYNITIDSAVNNTGYTIGAGCASTKIIGGVNDALTQYVQNNIDGVNNIYDFFATNNFVYIPRIHGEAWVTPTLLNSWVNFGGSEATVQYWKSATETVHIKGLIKDGTATTGTQIFVLPAGYRPTENRTFAQVCGAAGSRAVAAITVSVNGAVSVDTCSSNAALSIDCSFRVY